jgi:hypothetical protein
MAEYSIHRRLRDSKVEVWEKMRLSRYNLTEQPAWVLIGVYDFDSVPADLISFLRANSASAPRWAGDGEGSSFASREARTRDLKARSSSTI